MNNSKKNIIWLASYPKSGNTWVRLFLQHLLGTDQVQAGIPTLRDIPIASNRMLIDNYLGVDSADLTPQEIHEFRPDIYRALSARVGDMQILKVHDMFGKTNSGQSLFPNEITRHVIYIVRNPLDVVVSYSFHSGKTIQLTIDQLNDINFEISQSKHELQPQIAQHLGSWSDHVKSWTDQKELPVTIIKYEHLLDNAMSVFSNLLKKIGLIADIEVFEHALEATTFKRLKQMEETYGFSEKPLQAISFFRDGKKDIYKNHLSIEQINEIVKHHGVVMKRFGYLINL